MINSTTFHRVNPIGYTWLIFCGFYLTQITFLSPIYISFLVTCTVLLFHFASKTKLKIDNSISKLLCISLLFSFLIFNSPFPIFINLFISLISPLFASVFFKGKTIKIKHIFFIFLVYALLFNIDGFWRLINPDLTNSEKLEALKIGFQIYKTNSIMYSDSNYVGLQSLFFISVYIYLLRGLNIKITKRILYYIILLLLVSSIILSFSRSAIFGMIVLFFLLLTSRLNKFNFTLIFISISLILFTLFSEHFSNDISYQSKFHILSITDNYLKKVNIIDFLFGVGLGNAVNVIGIGSHNLLITFLIESGVIGLSAFLIILFYFLIKLKYDFFIVVFPFILASMSLGTTALPYFFTFTCLCIFKKNNQLIILP